MSATQTASRPNILLIMCDQLRWDYVGCYGVNPWIQTPNIDALAAEGCRAECCYSPNPVCIPARHNMITGLPARYHGFDDNYFGPAAKNCPWNLPTFAQICSDAGYSTVAIGKMHFQPERRATGFDHFFNMDEVLRDVMEDDYALFLREQGYGSIGSLHGVRNVLYQQPQQWTLPDEMHGSHWVADRTIDYIKSRGKQDRPFLCWTGFIQPHPPLSSPASYSHLYDGKVPQHTSSKTPLSKFAEENKCIADHPDEETVNRHRELYASAITWVDYNIGRIIEALRETDQLDNTLIIFTSDHGEMLGDCDTYQKFLAYDGSCRVPFIMRWPSRVEAGSVKKEFVDLNDLLPTFADLAGTSYPGPYELPGESLFAAVPQKDRRYQYVEHQRESKRWCCLRDERWKLVHYYGDDEQMFDMLNDPLELENLLYARGDEPEIRAAHARLREKLLQYEEKWGLAGYVENGAFRQFPPYEISTYMESCYPKDVVRMRGDEEILRPLEDEIFDAIKDEPTVHLSRLHIRENLTAFGGFTDERVDALLNRAKEEGRY